MEYGIQVVFKDGNYWSKTYTYVSKIPYEKGDVVVVRKGTFYSLGKVTGCIENFERDPQIKYMDVVQKVIDK